MLNRLIAVLCVAATIFASPLGAGAQEKFSVDKVVAVVGNSAVFYSELLEMTKEVEEGRLKYGNNSDQSARDQALEQLLMRKLLYNQALIDSVLINEEYLHELVEGQTTEMTNQAGSIGALEQREGMSMYDIRGRIRKIMEEMLYANSMRYTVIQNVRITPGEVERFYDNMDKSVLGLVPEQYVYSQITKYPFNSAGAKQRARERLLEMRERIIGGEKFDMLARMYSVHPTAMRGGESEFLELDVHFKPFADVLVMLQPGQVSEVVETPDGFHIVEKLDQRGTAYKYRQILLRPLFTDDELVEADRFLDSLAGRIRAGEITFEEAAKKNSDDKYSRENGGIVTNHEAIEEQMGNRPDISYSSTRFFREQLLRQDYYALSALKPGELSNSYRSIDMRENPLSKIVRLEQVIPSHTANLNDDYIQLEQAALSVEQEEVFNKWLEKKIESMYVKIAPEYSDASFLSKGWVK